MSAPPRDPQDFVTVPVCAIYDRYAGTVLTFQTAGEGGREKNGLMVAPLTLIFIQWTLQTLCSLRLGMSTSRTYLDVL